MKHTYVANMTISVNLMQMKNLKILIILLLVVACEGTDEILFTEESQKCHSSIVTSGKYYEKNDQQYLAGGLDSATHFNVSGWSLNPCYLSNGLGRESFHALIEPEYVELSLVRDQYPDNMEALVLLSSPHVKVYPFSTLRVHELINDMIDGVPIMAVYCYLADLVAVYERTYCDQVLTFAVSGFTYKDPYNYQGLESFILWDRNSESLWWPIIDEGVSGTFQNTGLRKYNPRLWGRATMGEVKKMYPNSLVIKEGQTLTVPDNIISSGGCK